MGESDNKIQLVKYAPPPRELPITGNLPQEELLLIGRSNYTAPLEDKRFIFGIKQTDRRRHVYVIGKSGVGKTKLLELMLRQDILYGRGVILIDPHGDSIEALLDFIPESRVEDVCLIDPGDTEYPVSFNPLFNVESEFKHSFTQGLIEVMGKQFGANWTPRLEHVFRFTILALLDYKEATMNGIILMLTDRLYRQRVIEHIEDDMVRRFWAIEFADWSEKFNSDAIIPLVNKLSQFLSNPLLRNIFGQSSNKVDIADLMNKKKILLINLSKGRIGEENSSFFGSMFLTKIKQAGMARAKIKESERVDCYVYADEFQSIVTDTFEDLLSESRKYGINMVMAHQYFNQLSPKVGHAVLGNTGTIITFRVGGDDAERLEKEMEPVFKVKDMINLGKQQFYIKMTIDGETYDPFSAETLTVKGPPNKSQREAIIAQSRAKFAVPLAKIASPANSANESIFSSQESAPTPPLPPPHPLDEPEPLI